MDAEDSMEPIEPVKLNQIEPVEGSSQIDLLFSQAINLSEGMVLHEPTCQLCSSPYREEVEQKYLETKSYKDAIKLFKDRSGNDISKSVIENHMRFHYDRAVRELQKIEYAEQIKRYSGQNLTTLDRIQVCCAILTERIMGVNSVIPSEDESVADIEKLKSTETARLVGQLKEFMKLQAAMMGEMKTTGELISIPTKDFINIINKAVAAAKTEGERELVKLILDNLNTVSQKAK